jgi:hypothetical protein
MFGVKKCGDVAINQALDWNGLNYAIPHRGANNNTNNIGAN